MLWREKRKLVGRRERDERERERESESERVSSS